jgi:hypothetical protein
MQVERRKISSMQIKLKLSTVVLFDVMIALRYSSNIICLPSEGIPFYAV